MLISSVHDISVESYAAEETDEDVKMNTQVDEINAYSFLYPVELPGKKFSFKWYFTSLYFNSVPSTLVRILLLFTYCPILFCSQGRVQKTGAIFLCSTTIS